MIKLLYNDKCKERLPEIVYMAALSSPEVVKLIIEIPKISKISQEIPKETEAVFDYLWDEIYKKKDDFQRSIEISDDKKETELPKKQNEIFLNALTTLWDCGYQDKIKSYLTQKKEVKDKLGEVIKKDSAIQILEELKQCLCDESEISVTSTKKLDQNNNRDLVC